MRDESSTERFRLFVAIPIPDKVREEMIRVQRELQPLAPSAAVHWTQPEQFHLTLKFLGDVPVERVEVLQQAMQPVCAERAALQLRAHGVGFFPNARSPRVIWVGMDDDGSRLAELQAKIQIATREFSAEQRAEKFSGHATLGRFKRYQRREIDNLLRRGEMMGDRNFGEWTAREVEIVSSKLSPAGACHTPLAALALAAE